jgi:hypothetical protein
MPTLDARSIHIAVESIPEILPAFFLVCGQTRCNRSSWFATQLPQNNYTAGEITSQEQISIFSIFHKN